MADTSNEITAIPHLIKVLALAGQIITLDTMGSHTHIAEATYRDSLLSLA